jgi:hypothetical protein
MTRGNGRPARDYPKAWPVASAEAKAAAGHRCIRCRHRAEGNKYDRHLPCDRQCVERYHPDGLWTPEPRKPFEHLDRRRVLRTRKQRILTVHHLDGDKANLAWWNLAALCQVCHLVIQGKSRNAVVRIYADPAWLEREPWLVPYAIGWWAAQHGEAISRGEADERALAIVFEDLALQAELEA